MIAAALRSGRALIIDRITDRLWLAGLCLAALVLGMPLLTPLFAWLYPALERPFYQGDSFLALTAAHLALVGASSLAAVLVGCLAGILVTRPAGAEFRGFVDALVAIAQTFPPVAVLALTVPVTGFGAVPALIALSLYALLPIVENTIGGLESVPPSALEAARGLGMGPVEALFRVELPLAAPVIVGGIRTAVIINVGTAAIASTVGAKTLGLPIIVGLNGANGAYVIQGTVIVGWLAIVIDLAFGRLVRALSRWRSA